MNNKRIKLFTKDYKYLKNKYAKLHDIISTFGKEIKYEMTDNFLTAYEYSEDIFISFKYLIPILSTKTIPNVILTCSRMAVDQIGIISTDAYNLYGKITDNIINNKVIYLDDIVSLSELFQYNEIIYKILNEYIQQLEELNPEIELDASDMCEEYETIGEFIEFLKEFIIDVNRIKSFCFILAGADTYPFTQFDEIVDSSNTEIIKDVETVVTKTSNPINNFIFFILSMNFQSQFEEEIDEKYWRQYGDYLW